MKALVIGAGMMGSALAYDLAGSRGVGEVILADIDAERALHVAANIGPAVRPERADVTDRAGIVSLMREADVAIGATTYQHNIALSEAAIEARRPFLDLGGNMDVVDAQLQMHRRAADAGILIVPNCGLAPGLACVLASGAAGRFAVAEDIHIRVGGLPQHPVPPLNYQLVFSVEGLINEYLEPSEVVRDGKLEKVESMTEIEPLDFPPPYRKLEAFHTSGGISTLARMYAGKAKSVDYKTIRYQGHCEKFKTLLDLGFASTEPIAVGNTLRTARELFEELLKRKLPAAGPDVVLVEVRVTGSHPSGGRRTLAYQMIDCYDERAKISAMMRTTAFPTSIIAQMVARGEITERGVAPPEACVPLEPFIAGLRQRNIMITETLSSP
jgi:lysine 6-dehydrogenase